MKTIIAGVALIAIGIAVQLGVTAWITITDTGDEPATPTWVLAYVGSTGLPLLLGCVLVVVGLVRSFR